MIDRDRLASEMKRQGLTQALLAKAASVSPASIQQILNGKTRNPRSTKAIAQALGVSRDWLEGVSDNPQRRFALDVSEDDFDAIAIEYFTREFEKPIGEPDATVLTRIVLFSKSWLRTVLPESLERGVVLYRFGSKDMAPTILNGDDVMLLGLDTFDGEPGSIWMLDFDGRSIVRRVMRQGGGLVSLFADNPSVPALTVAEASLKFIGKIVWQGRKLA